VGLRRRKKANRDVLGVDSKLLGNVSLDSGELALLDSMYVLTDDDHDVWSAAGRRSAMNTTASQLQSGTGRFRSASM